MENHHQVAVIGAGIAGCACCLRLAQKGLEPIWIGGKCNGARDKPGELLSAAARPILSELGIETLLGSEKHRPAHAMFSVWGSDRLAERNSILHLEGPQMVLNRSVFETDLIEGVLDTGIHLVNEELVAAEPVETGWKLSLGSREITCAFAIDASGRKAVLAGPQTARFRADKLAALYAFLVQDSASDVEPSPATLVEAVPSGWLYATLLPDWRLALNFYTDADLLPSRRTIDGDWAGMLRDSVVVRRWIDEAGFRFSDRHNVASAATTWLAPCAASTWLAAGDAAAAFDPLSSHGMTSALWSGLKGADAAVASIKGDLAGVRDYNDRVARGIQDFLLARKRIYEMEVRFKDRVFWQRRGQIETAMAERAD